MKPLKNSLITIELPNAKNVFWTYKIDATKTVFEFAGPRFEIDNIHYVVSQFEFKTEAESTLLANGSTEYTVTGKLPGDAALTLSMRCRIAPDDPVVRFCYILTGGSAHKLTKSKGTDDLIYLATSCGDKPQVTEVRFSEFNDLYHSYNLSERKITPAQFDTDACLMGPMLVGESADYAMLMAYEHGSQAPDAYVEFALAADRTVSLRAKKGNYYNGQPLDKPYQTIWLQVAAVKGTLNTLAQAYRTFVLSHQTQNPASRTPYIFYNTWAYQERNKWWNKKTFLDSMHQDRIMAEIDVAYRMGVDVFVIDTGWYEKTGDWAVNSARFPDGLKSIKEKLDGYGMKMGLWFDPTKAAQTSSRLNDNRDCIASIEGKEIHTEIIWETEASYAMCLSSKFADAFVDELIRLVKEVGVTYFKWDGIWQYGCNNPNHNHGTTANSAQERLECYSFELGRQMAYIVDRLCAVCPEAIVDFDVTEGQRNMGLSFLSAGKYFLINNGPYFPNYNIPWPEDKWINIFVHPGNARPWICRIPLSFDKWLPSVLFLTHYLPDDPAPSQLVNLASMILGQNGIWGDLLQVSQEGISLYSKILGMYKQIRDDITASFPVRSGEVGGSPEVHEKISATSQKGAVVIFSSARGVYTYTTENPVVKQYWKTEGVEVSFDKKGRAIISATFAQSGAQFVLFGVA